MIQKRYLTFLIILLSGFTVLMTGCRSSKAIVKKPSKQEMEVIRSLVLEGTDYNNISSKMEFKIFPKEGVSAGMKGNIKISRDSCLIISLQPFAGIEIVRCLIRPDSVFVISRLHSTYSAESIDRLPFSELKPYHLLEAILMNRIFIPGKVKPENEDLDNFMSYKGKEGEFISYTKDSFNLSFRIDKDQQFDQLTVGTENILKALEAKYSKFERTNKGIFPHLLELQTNISNKKLGMQILFLEPSFDKNTDFKFVIPSRYKKLTLEEMLKKFSNML